ncbi:MAG: hypothetical protein ISS80_05665 [Candidatus Cloacimonetes bacterium]|nr:hypothetical protein [Candidatus Cloacimonadota bacterium]MBL7149542.1 hypothetical protein [Candidatus Cloacimonadota bacterium]
MRKIILILLVIIFTYLHLCGLTQWMQISLRNFTTDAEHDIDIITGATPQAETIDTASKDGIYWQHEISGNLYTNLSFTLENDLFVSDLSHEFKNSFFYNDAKIKVYYQNESQYLKLQYANRTYNPAATNFLNIPGVEHSTQQQMVHNTALHYKGHHGRFFISLYGNLRNLDYEYLTIEEDDVYESESAWDNDIYSYAEFSYKITDIWKAFVSGYYKDDLNSFNEFDDSNLGIGLEFDNRFDFFNAVKTKVVYYNKNFDSIDDEKDHYFLTEARYTKRFGNSLTGFVTYINRSCYDEDQSKFFRISNMLRIHAKYSYLTYNMKDSFILAGIKYNPENEGNLVFGEMNQYLFKDVYLTAGVKYANELFGTCSAKCEYFVTPLRSIWINNKFTNFNKKSTQNIFSLGTTLIF